MTRIWNPERGHRIAAVGLVLLLLAIPLSRAAAQGEIVLPGLTEGELKEADLQQGVVIVVVWASWSPRCRDIVPRLNEVADRWGGEARVVSVVFQEEAAAVKSFLVGKNLAVPVFLDETGAFSRKHAVTTLPGLLIFRDGQRAFRGRLPADPHSLIGQTLG